MLNLFSKKSNNKKQLGSTMILIIVFASIFAIIIGGIINLIILQNKLAKILNAKDTAIQIAEAGINYYRWHLAHAEADYTDGHGGCAYPSTCGPYAHDYKDHLTGQVIGTFSLLITPPPAGSTVTVINSTGWLTSYPNQKRIIEVQYGKPSLAKYAILSNVFLNVSTGTTTYGLIHSNAGVRFDGVANNLVTSHETTFDDPDHSGASDVPEYGVHTHVNPPPGSGIDSTFRPNEAPPTSITTRTDVFRAGRIFPVDNVEFNNLSQYFNDSEEIAEDDTACEISGDGCTLGSSSKAGWHIKINGTTFKYIKVKTTTTCNYSCPTPGYSSPIGDIASYQGSWSGDISLPSSGVIFVKDNVWVDGTINGRVTIIAATEPFSTTSGGANIWVNDNLRYTDYGGTDAIALIAQNNISVGLYSKDELGVTYSRDDFYIDAAMVAKNGRVGRYFYPASCNATYRIRNTITVYGSIITNGSNAERYNFYRDLCTSSSGFTTRNINYDTNFTLTPPPNFPTEDNYTFLSWEEKTP